MADVNRRILIVEDDDDLREALTDTLELAGMQPTAVGNGQEALSAMADVPFDMVVSDVSMPEMDGHTLLREVRDRHPQVPVALITAFGSIDKSVQAMRDGAADYLVKPFAPEVLVDTVRRYTGWLAADGQDDEPVAQDHRSLELLGLARRIATTDSTVLLLGESGTGKEVLSHYIHRHSARSSGPFIALNCAAIPENMLEAMLFGHEKGAFTGAYQAKPGKFEQADRGSLLLDEISEMDTGLQAKLLRVIQEKEVERLGGRSPEKVDVRVIATSNRDLREEVAAKRFREDLYYRLSVFPLVCSPLRERRDDILPLAKALASRHARKMGRAPVRFDQSAERALLHHDWPGNVRELENVVQRALILQSGDTISAGHLQLDPFGQCRIAKELNQHASADSDSALHSGMRQHELDIIVDTFHAVGGSKKAAAEKLGISPRTLRYKLARMRQAGIDVEAQLARKA